ncbi:MGDG synthase family glycosyltransferase [Cohnella terricola]|uniref:Glycosyltransferase n=1 Tax=Cohnella terricola TaxID=1289167 RepID=A0A559JN74_9BACL|nr:glycosyltransferase [Cohnella terricola]TVY01316.1 glycosyltransferase [Cohnella terricola]
MTEPRKIFILYARFGEGHLQAASALRQSFVQQGEAEVKLIDLLAESHPVINEVSRFVYNKSYNVLPQVYGWVYETTKSMKPDSLFSSWLHSFGALTLRRLIERERPDAIVHTFPMLVLPLVARKLRKKIPMFNVVTDFDLHRRWVHPDVSKYYVATEDIRQQLCELGVEPHRVAASGIPIRPGFFRESIQSLSSAGSLGEFQKPNVLVMPCVNSAPTEIAAICRNLTRRCNALVTVVCGRNQMMQRYFSDTLRGVPGVTVLGYVEQIGELMANSSCIVTKPGGLTLSEALASELPIFLYRPVPGQERNNAIYLESKGAAVVCSSVQQLLGAVSELLQSPNRREEMLRAIQALRKKDASDAIALDISRQLNIMEEATSSTAMPTIRYWDESSRIRT